MRAKAVTQGGPAPRLRAWAPASARATEKEELGTICLVQTTRAARPIRSSTRSETRTHARHVTASPGLSPLEQGGMTNFGRIPYLAKAGCPTITGRRRTREAPVGMAPALSWW